jgi:hypothetical protein
MNLKPTLHHLAELSASLGHECTVALETSGLVQVVPDLSIVGPGTHSWSGGTIGHRLMPILLHRRLKIDHIVQTEQQGIIL